VVEHLADRVAVMYLGRIVEIGPARAVFGRPAHPYTQALLASVLTPDPAVPIPDPRLRGTMPNPLDPPPGCRFHPRCPHVMPICAAVDPADRMTEAGVEVACHLYEPAPALPADGGRGPARVGAAGQDAAR
jgi:peptide/nickel transport system ATP-binding protein